MRGEGGEKKRIKGKRQTERRKKEKENENEKIFVNVLDM